MDGLQLLLEALVGVDAAASHIKIAPAFPFVTGWVIKLLLSDRNSCKCYQNSCELAFGKTLEQIGRKRTYAHGSASGLLLSIDHISNESMQLEINLFLDQSFVARNQ